MFFSRLEGSQCTRCFTSGRSCSMFPPSSPSLTPINSSFKGSVTSATTLWLWCSRSPTLPLVQTSSPLTSCMPTLWFSQFPPPTPQILSPPTEWASLQGLMCPISDQACPTQLFSSGAASSRTSSWLSWSMLRTHATRQRSSLLWNAGPGAVCCPVWRNSCAAWPRSISPAVQQYQGLRSRAQTSPTEPDWYSQ